MLEQKNGFKILDFPSEEKTQHVESCGQKISPTKTCFPNQHQKIYKHLSKCQVPHEMDLVDDGWTKESTPEAAKQFPKKIPCYKAVDMVNIPIIYIDQCFIAIPNWWRKNLSNHMSGFSLESLKACCFLNQLLQSTHKNSKIKPHSISQPTFCRHWILVV